MINHLNSLLIEGVLIDDPEIVARVNEMIKVKFTIASDYFYLSSDGENKKDTLILPVQVWDTLGKRCLEKLRKGMTARCVGKLKMRCKLEDESGDIYPSVELVAKHVEYKDRKSKKMEFVETAEEE